MASPEELLSLAEEAGALLARKRETLGIAESCTGGLLAAVITEIPGSSAYFLGGVVAYHNRVKKKLLRVTPGCLRRYGAVSAETAARMARGACQATGARIGLSLTGIAGPAGETGPKPVGLVYIGLDAGKERRVTQYNFTGTRAEIRRAACQQALEILVSLLRR